MKYVRPKAATYTDGDVNGRHNPTNFLVMHINHSPFPSFSTAFDQSEELRPAGDHQIIELGKSAEASSSPGPSSTKNTKNDQMTMYTAFEN